MTDPARVLVVQASSPRVPGSPDSDAEYREISQSVTGARYGHAVALHCLQAARAHDLTDRLLREVPAVLHLSARTAPDSGLRFLTDDGGQAPIRDDGLVKLPAECVADGLGLVVLSACWSSELASQLAATVPCVLGTAGEITDHRCRDYSRTFYGALAHGRSMGATHRMAVGAAEMYGAEPAFLPELHTAPGVNADARHLVAAAWRVPPSRPPSRPQEKPRGSALPWRLGKPRRPRAP